MKSSSVSAASLAICAGIPLFASFHALDEPRSAISLIAARPAQAMSSKAALQNSTSVRPRNAATTSAALLRYQRALDQLAAGRVREARALAEDARRRYGDTPELNLLLGYLLQRENRPEVARDRLGRVASASPLAAAFASQLREAAVSASAPAPDKTLGDEMVERGVVQEENSDDDVVIIAGTAASLRQGDRNLAALERALAARVNAERQRAGLSVLTLDETLAGVARAHSADMRDRKYFAHESPTDALRGPLDRYRAVFRKTPAVVAENVFRSWGTPRALGGSDIAEAHESLMKSPGHRSNILLPRVTHIGIGLAINASGDLWITQLFARP